jgi:hypothetical protein
LKQEVAGEEEAGVLRIVAFEDEESATQSLYRLDNIPVMLAEFS